MTDRQSYDEVKPTPLELPAFLPYACGQLQADFALRVNTQLQDEYVSKTTEDKIKKGKAGKSTIQATSRTFESPTKTESASGGAYTDEEDEPVVLTAVLDAGGRLVELQLTRASLVPCLLLKVIAMCIPYQSLLYKLSIRWAQLDGTAIYEIAKFLSLSHITEICLDDSPVPQCNYALLLDVPSTLRSLSLARCNLGDAGCEELAARLYHPLPAARNLVMLSMPTNHITDVGASALADALRSNRCLQYLNLCGNQVSDEGAAAIFGCLMEFPMTAEELITKRRRLLDYLIAKEELFKKCLSELSASLLDRPLDEGRGGRRKTATTPASSVRSRKSLAGLVGVGTTSSDALVMRAQIMVTELLGSYTDPFSIDETVAHDQYLYSVGNTTLCMLNLAYNNLGYASLARLTAVLKYQEALPRKAGTGLLRVLVEGNPLPLTCPEMNLVQDLLEKALTWKLAKPQKKPEKTSGKAKSK